MSDTQLDTTENDRLILNYDPARYGSFKDYIVVEFSSGETLFFPPGYFDKFTEDQRKEAVLRALTLYRYGNHIICPDKLAADNLIEDIADLVSLAAASTVTINLFVIFGLKLKASDNPTISMRFECEALPTNRDELDDLIFANESVKLIEKIQPLVFKEITVDHSASWFVWGHIFFRILCAIERDHGPIEAIAPAEFDKLFEQYKESELGEALHEATFFYGAGVAHQFLEAINPAQWSLESFMEFYGYEPSDGDCPSVRLEFSTDETPSPIKSLIKSVSGNNSAQVVLSYDLPDGKPPSAFRLEMKSEAVDLSRLIEKAKSSRGGANNRRTYLRTDDELKEFVLKVDELRPHWETIKNWFVEQDYDGGCVKAIQTLDWFQDLSARYGGIPESVLKLVMARKDLAGKKNWPLAFALEHARIMFRINKPLRFDRLYEVYKEGRKHLDS